VSAHPCFPCRAGTGRPFECHPTGTQRRPLQSADVDVDDPVLARLEIVDVGDTGNFKAPIHRFERSVALKEIDRDDEGLTDLILTPSPEEFETARITSADILPHRHATKFGVGLADDGEVEKLVVADDGIIAFEHVLAKWVEDISFAETRILRDSDAPSVLNHHKIGVFRQWPAPVP
jgi:hypothetical protein